MNVKVLGPGCDKCRKLHAEVARAHGLPQKLFGDVGDGRLIQVFDQAPLHTREAGGGMIHQNEGGVGQVEIARGGDHEIGAQPKQAEGEDAAVADEQRIAVAVRQGAHELRKAIGGVMPVFTAVETGVQIAGEPAHDHGFKSLPGFEIGSTFQRAAVDLAQAFAQAEAERPQAQISFLRRALATAPVLVVTCSFS